ncbi:hypothetical protein GCM10011326_41000 [Salipiger profundus]|jgi:hypothetical protein|nr:hypothetical protein GCM10011326_41000 [Salipiger profundus]
MAIPVPYQRLETVEELFIGLWARRKGVLTFVVVEARDALFATLMANHVPEFTLGAPGVRVLSECLTCLVAKIFPADRTVQGQDSFSLKARRLRSQRMRLLRRRLVGSGHDGSRPSPSP